MKRLKAFRVKRGGFETLTGLLRKINKKNYLQSIL